MKFVKNNRFLILSFLQSCLYSLTLHLFSKLFYTKRATNVYVVMIIYMSDFQQVQ